MDLFSEMGEHCLKILSKHPDRVYSTAVLLDIYGHLTPLNDNFDYILLKSNSNWKKKSMDEKNLHAIAKFWSNLKGSIIKLFDQTLEDVKTDPEKTMPADGTVHPLTNSTINYLVQLTNDDGVVPSYKSIATQFLPDLKTYITQMISTLRTNLERKAVRGDSIPGLAAIFKLNNFYFITKKVKSTDIAKEIGTDTIALYKEWIENEKKSYFQIWKKAKDFLSEEWKPDKNLIVGIGKSKQNEEIKQRFAGFNKQFKDLLDTQECFRIPDDKLCQKMREIVRRDIYREYKIIYDKYKDVNFSKRHSEYVKYSPETVEKMILTALFQGILKEDTKIQTVIKIITKH